MGIAKQIGSRVKQLRELRNFTQEELAEKSETSSQYISALERGQKNATLEVLEKVAKGLGIELFSLFCFRSAALEPSKASIKEVLDGIPQPDLTKIIKIINIVCT